MFASRAVELVNHPLTRNKSHHIKVDRNAASFMLTDREEKLKEIEALKKQLKEAHAVLLLQQKIDDAKTPEDRQNAQRELRDAIRKYIFVQRDFGPAAS